MQTMPRPFRVTIVALKASTFCASESRASSPPPRRSGKAGADAQKLPVDGLRNHHLWSQLVLFMKH